MNSINNSARIAQPSKPLAPKKPPVCLECGDETSLARGSDVYPGEDHLAEIWVWKCQCGAFARCQPGTLIPVARPAGDETRRLRNEVFRLVYEILGPCGGTVKEKKLWSAHRFYIQRKTAYLALSRRKAIKFGYLTKDEARLCVEFLKQNGDMFNSHRSNEQSGSVA